MTSSSPPPSSVMAAFDLPAMPPSFEGESDPSPWKRDPLTLACPMADFQFSLNLPENITASDFGLVGSPDFSNLFGLPSSSGPFTPSALIAASEENTPKGASAMTKMASQDDTIMSNPLSRRASINSMTGLGGDSQMSHATPTVASQQPQYSVAPTIPSSNATIPGGNITFEEYMARNSFPAVAVPQVQSQPQMPIMSGAGYGVKGLFDANETNFLTNFLQGFEGWDFNPNLPMDLPSFADAERGAIAAGYPTTTPTMSDPRKHSRKSTGGSRGKASPGGSLGLTSPNQNLNNSNSMNGNGNGIDSSAGAAFGRHMADWNEEDDKSMSEQYTDERGRRKVSQYAIDEASLGKKIKMEHGGSAQQAIADAQAAAAASKREAMSDHEKRQNHILSEQRRRNHIREAFKELVDLLEAGREFGARGLGMSSGAGTGIEDEGLDDRSDYESTLEDEEASAATKRRKAKAKRRAAMEAVLNSGGRLSNGSVATRGRGKGRGRGGSAGGGAGSKSAVLFQAVDLLKWLEGRNEVVARQVEQLEEVAPPPPIAAVSAA